VLVRKGEFAKAKGVTPAAVTHAIRSGRLNGALVTENGKQLIDLERGLALWDERTLRNNNAKVGTPAGAAAAQAAAPAPAPTPAQLRAYIEAIPDLNESRARREHYQAEQAKLAALQGRGELVPVAEVKAQAFALARSVRDGLMGIPDRLAPMLAATQDARQVHHLLSEEIRVALRVLADG
jgi:hypothetical protein